MKMNSIKETYAMRIANEQFRPVRLLHLSILSLLLILAFLAFRAQAQNGSDGTTAVKTKGPSAESIRPYKPAGKDPFKKALKPKATSAGGSTRKAATEVDISFPSLDTRRAEFRQKVQRNDDLGLPAPDPVSQYLVQELTVLGVFQDEKGFGAFVRAQPTGTMFFARRGSLCYNGEILRIEANSSNVSNARVVFREVTYIAVNGKRAEQVRQVAKAPGAAEKSQ